MAQATAKPAPMDVSVEAELRREIEDLKIEVAKVKGNVITWRYGVTAYLGTLGFVLGLAFLYFEANFQRVDEKFARQDAMIVEILERAIRNEEMLIRQEDRLIRIEDLVRGGR